jgi:hypothetical protein
MCENGNGMLVMWCGKSKIAKVVIVSSSSFCGHIYNAGVVKIHADVGS